MDKIKTENKYIYLMGDFNINILNVNNHVPSSEFLDMMYSHSLIPLINKPTRVKNNSTTLIHNIFCNNLETSKLKSGILFTDITDHFPVFCIYQGNHQQAENEFYMKRIFSFNNINNFHIRLEHLDWSEILMSNHCQDAFTYFHKVFSDLYEECFPRVKIKIGYRNRKPWLTSGLKKSIKVKHKLYVKSIKMPSNYNIKQYKQYTNRLQSLLRKTERLHYDELFTINKSNLSKQWDIIKGIINIKKKTTISDRFVVNNKLVTDRELIANSFNTFYANIGSNLAKNLINNNKDPTTLISDNASSMFFTPVVPQK